MNEAKIEEKQVKPIKKIAKCPDCGVELESLGSVRLSNPPQHPYICPECGRKFIFNQSYPDISFEEIN